MNYSIARSALALDSHAQKTPEPGSICMSSAIFAALLRVLLDKALDLAVRVSTAKLAVWNRKFGHRTRPRGLWEIHAPATIGAATINLSSRSLLPDRPP